MTAEEFGWALIVVQRNSLVDAEITAIEELIATGNLARIRDLDLRSRIARTHLTVESLGRFIELVAARTAAFLPILHRRFQPSTPGHDSIAFSTTSTPSPLIASSSTPVSTRSTCCPPTNGDSSRP